MSAAWVAGGPKLGDTARSVWGKTDRKGTSPVGWLPLWRHLADSADVAGRLWDHWLSPAVQRELLIWMTERSGAGDRVVASSSAPLCQPVQAALTGLVMIADGIASNEDFFPYILDSTDADRLHVGWELIDLPVPWLPAE